MTIRVLLAMALLGLVPQGACVDTSGPAADGPQGGIDFPDCRWVEPIVAIGELPAELWEPVAQPRVSDGRVLWQWRHTNHGNSVDDIEIFQYDPVTGETDQLTANDWDDRIVDASYGATLFVTVDPDRGTYRLVLERGGEQTVLVEDLPWPLGPFYQAESRWVSRQAAVWLMPVDLERGWENSVFLFEGGEVQLISGDIGLNGSPDLRDLEVVWDASDGSDQEIAYSGPAERASDGPPFVWLTDNEVHDYAPLLSGRRVYWRAGDSPAFYDLDSQDQAVVEGRRCREHAADDGLAVYICSDVPDVDWPLPLPDQLVLLDGREERVLVADRGEIHDVAMDGRAAAWIEYPVGSDFYDNATGTVFYLADVSEADSEPLAISPVASGCWSCDAYWPDVDVRLEGNVLAWNYAGVELDQPPLREGFAVGYAVVQSPWRCGR